MSFGNQMLTTQTELLLELSKAINILNRVQLEQHSTKKLKN
jgi:hypothetical protein